MDTWNLYRSQPMILCQAMCKAFNPSFYKIISMKKLICGQNVIWQIHPSILNYYKQTGVSFVKLSSSSYMFLLTNGLPWNLYVIILLDKGQCSQTAQQKSTSYCATGIARNADTVKKMRQVGLRWKLFEL